MINKDTFMYDSDLDRIMIFNKIDKNEKIYGSVRILNLVLDLTTNNRIANIEIRDVSDYLKSLGKNPEILNNLKCAEINVNQVRGGFIIQIILTGENSIEKIPYTIPTEEKIIITA
jgi:hypothetical protein